VAIISAYSPQVIVTAGTDKEGNWIFSACRSRPK
jgi:hypothetical protein